MLLNGYTAPKRCYTASGKELQRLASFPYHTPVDILIAA